MNVETKVAIKGKQLRVALQTLDLQRFLYFQNEYQNIYTRQFFKSLLLINIYNNYISFDYANLLSKQYSQRLSIWLYLSLSLYMKMLKETKSQRDLTNLGLISKFMYFICILVIIFTSVIQKQVCTPLFLSKF